MKFGLICGNPPYNNDLYLDFMNKGILNSDKYCIWIVPSKWQIKDSASCNYFRENILKHISKINTSSSKEIFEDIADISISYFLIDKSNNFNDKVINGKLVKNFDVKQGLTPEVINIVRKVQSSTEYISIISDNSIFVPTWGYFTSVGCISYIDKYRTDNIDKNNSIYFCDSQSSIEVSKDIIKQDKLKSEDQFSLSCTGFLHNTFTGYIRDYKHYEQGGDCTLYVGTKKECLYAKSYFNCKLIRFLTVGVFGSSIKSSTKWWVNVPSPIKYDHEFTDKELYDKYNLTSSEINYIDNVLNCSNK